jgi:hypothetical protein
MRQNRISGQRKPEDMKTKGLEWLLYLPGAIIISYGLWLSITLN